MPYYKGVLDGLIAGGHGDQARDAAGRLLSLRHKLSKEVPQRNVLSTVLIATWNIREFGGDHKFGKRLDESLLYIAEIISHFDLVAVQEVNQNLDTLQRLMKLLGGWWDYMVTDVTLGASGNSERIAFVYDGRKVRFDHLAGELALPPIKGKPVRQPARSPFICGFKVGWRRVSLCSVHIFFGESKPDDPVRVEEIRDVSAALAQRNVKRQNVSDGEPENVVLLGDFNIFNKEGDKTSAALEENDFVVPKAIRLAKEKRTITVPAGDALEGEDITGSNLDRSKHFDQIAFHDPKGQLKASRGGVFDFQSVIYGPNEAQRYRGAIDRSDPEKLKKATTKKELEKLYRQWRTFQISDHLPLWVELKTDFANNYLAFVMHGNKKPSGPSTAAGRKAEALSRVETPPPIANGLVASTTTQKKKKTTRTTQKKKTGGRL